MTGVDRFFDDEDRRRARESADADAAAAEVQRVEEMVESALDPVLRSSAVESASTELAASMARLAARLHGQPAHALVHARHATKRRLVAAKMGRRRADDLIRAYLGRIPSAERLQAEAVLASRPHPYEELDGCIVLVSPSDHGVDTTPVTNFTATIEKELIYDDGTGATRRFLQLEAQVAGATRTVTVSSDDFAKMSWVLPQLGPSAIVRPGKMMAEHARAAIQSLSGQPPVETIYEHTGWRVVDDQQVYLHGEGAIGPAGSVDNCRVELPDGLAQIALPDPPTGRMLEEAVLASIRLLDVAPDRVTVPAWAAVWRAPLERSTVSVELTGPSGVGKTTLAACLVQHYGARLTAESPMAGFVSTANSLERLAHCAKDCILWIDDFAPTGSARGDAALHAIAERLFRGAANHTGRSRMGADATLRPTYRPRGLILTTGEDVPAGHSLRARIATVSVGPSDIDWCRITDAQRDGNHGLFAQAMAAYLQWYAANYEKLIVKAADDHIALRRRAHRSDAHKRVASNVATLAVGVRMFVRFAMAYGVLSPRQAVGLWRRAWAALSTLAAAQGGHHVAADPVDRYVELLCSAISSGLAHVASVADGPPKDALALGWRPYHHGSEIDLRPQGERVGWVNGDDLFLDPTSAYRAVQAAARGGAPVALAEHTMRLRLRERGLLVASEDQRLTVRKQIGHVRRHVLHLQTKTIRGPVHPVHPIHGPGGSNGSVRQEQSDTKEGM